MTGAALGFMVTIWAVIFVMVFISLNAILKGEAKKAASK